MVPPCSIDTIHVIKLLYDFNYECNYKQETCCFAVTRPHTYQGRTNVLMTTIYLKIKISASGKARDNEKAEHTRSM